MINQYEIAADVIRNYLDENDLESFEKVEMEDMFSNFQETFSPEVLQNLEGKDVLNKLFLHDGDHNTLMYNLEYNTFYNPAGSISGGSAAKYNLFKSEGSWKYGNNPKSLKKSLKKQQLNMQLRYVMRWLGVPNILKVHIWKVLMIMKALKKT